jgi:hypothetical protein
MPDRAQFIRLRARLCGKLRVLGRLDGDLGAGPRELSCEEQQIGFFAKRVTASSGQIRVSSSCGRAGR